MMYEQMSLLNNESTIDNFIDVEQPLIPQRKFSVASLFCGCGGMDLGFKGDFKIFGKSYEKNPYEIVFANDINQRACDTYTHNFKHRAFCEDINELDLKKIPKADVVIGGFPCQDFSLAGKRKGLSSKRGQLYLQMKKVIDHLNPLAFVAENVDGIRTLGNSTYTSALYKIINDFRASGYNVDYKLLNSADYGVPQKRRRIIIIGIRKDLNRLIHFPQPVRSKDSNISPWMTAKDAIDDLWDKLDDPNIYNHSTKDYSKAKFYPNKKTQGNKRIEANEPSCTIRAEHHGNIEGHYRTYNSDDPLDMKSWRRLSVRECARLQSFPDNFNFSCSASAAYKQVGNAVPPILAWYISRALYLSIMKRK